MRSIAYSSSSNSIYLECLDNSESRTRPGRATRHTPVLMLAYNSPDAATVTFERVAPLCEPTASTALTTSIPLVTLSGGGRGG